MNLNIASRFLGYQQSESSADFNRLLRRASVQFEFARASAALVPDSQKTWLLQVNKAESLLDSVDPWEGTPGLHKALSDAEQ